MKKISIVTACYNEQENIEEVYLQVKKVFASLPSYHYEHIFIDNASTDRTVDILREIAAQDKNVKIIINTRNFGHIRSPSHALLQAKGDAVISIVADLQDPPEMIKDFLREWEKGYKIVVGVKPDSVESFLMRFVRKSYYHFIAKIADVQMIRNFTGFGLYDQSVIQVLRQYDDPYPYFRGLIAEVGFEVARVPYTQPARRKGVTKNNFYAYYDMAMLGITSYSKIPLRLATMAGFFLSGVSLIVSIIFFISKLIYWHTFNAGIAPVLVGLFFFSSMQLFFIGLLGEYVATIHTRVMKRPLVVEKERINYLDQRVDSVDVT